MIKQKKKNNKNKKKKKNANQSTSVQPSQERFKFLISFGLWLRWIPKGVRMDTPDFSKPLTLPYKGTQRTARVQTQPFQPNPWRQQYPTSLGTSHLTTGTRQLSSGPTIHHTAGNRPPSLTEKSRPHAPGLSLTRKPTNIFQHYTGQVGVLEFRGCHQKALRVAMGS